MPASARSTTTGAASTSRPMCCRFRRCSRPDRSGPTTRRGCLATSRSPMRPPAARPTTRKSRSSIPSAISRYTAFCIWSATITRTIPTPRTWRASRPKSSRSSVFPIPMRSETPGPVWSGRTEMTDSEPTHDNPRNTRNLPAVVQDGEVMRPSAEGWLSRAIRTLFGWKPGSVRDDLQVVLDASTPDEVGFSAIERTMLRNILGLHEQRIADVMIHRADIVAVKRDITLGELMSLFESAAHSRLVVYNETLDDPEGIVHIRDLLAFMTTRARVTEIAKTKRKKALPAGLDLRGVDLALPLADASIIRKLLYVPPSMRAIDLLVQMQASRIHLALVVDEYGGTDGLVSIEEIVEKNVREIDDEHDREEPPAIVRQADNSFIADPRASLDDVRSVIGEEFVTGEAGEEVETLGGYLVTYVGRLPVRGEVISGPGNFEIEVLDADPRRVKRLRIATRKERAPLRAQRESRRRETTSDATQPGDQTNPPADGAASS